MDVFILEVQYIGCWCGEITYYAAGAHTNPALLLDYQTKCIHCDTDIKMRGFATVKFTANEEFNHGISVMERCQTCDFILIAKYYRKGACYRCLDCGAFVPDQVYLGCTQEIPYHFNHVE